MNAAPLKVLVRTPLNAYSGYGRDGVGICQALERWGCDVYVEPTYVAPPLPEGVAKLLTKHLKAPFDLLIQHADPDNLGISKIASDCSEVKVSWSMWEFCVTEDHEIFTRRGWLRRDQLRAGDHALGINPGTGLSEWQEIKSVNVFDGERDMVSFSSGRVSAVSTLAHRWLVNDRDGNWAWRTTATLRERDGIPRAAVCADLPAEPKYSDAYVELVAWAYTEGWLERGRQLRIGQNARTSPEKVQRIRAALGMLSHRVARNSPQHGQHTWSEGIKPDGMVIFNVSQSMSDTLMAAMPGKVPAHEFLLSLTRAQLELFIDVSCMADGWAPKGGGRCFGQTSGPRMEAFIYACVLAGKTVSRQQPNTVYPHLSSVIVGSHFRTGRVMNRTAVHHQGIVWCPTVRLGNWLARHDGTIFFTGNSDAKPLAHRVSSYARRMGRFDLNLMYDQVAIDAWRQYGPKRSVYGILQGGYEAADWKYYPERDWFGDRFMFIMHGQLHNRKAPYVTIQAFNELKHEKKDDFAGARLGLHTTIGDPLVVFGHLIPGMKVWHEMWEKEVLEEFYHAAHVLVAPSRGEGKNLPALEMMTTGGAVAATNWGGHTQWIHPEYAYPLDYTLTPTEPAYPDGAHDAKVTTETMKEFMWHAYTHREEVKRKAELAAQTIPKMCDWSVVIERFFDRVRDLVPDRGEKLWVKAQQCRRG